MGKPTLVHVGELSGGRPGVHKKVKVISPIDDSVFSFLRSSDASSWDTEQVG
jgi:hypothetical protein